MPCETQQAPDLRSNALPAPNGTKIDLDSSAVQAANATATTKAVDWLRKLLASERSSLKVASAPTHEPLGGRQVKTAIRKHFKDFAAIVGLAVIALGVAGYVLAHQRLRFPIIQSSPYKLKAEFSTAQAVTPGQGQTVRVSGVRIGDVSGVDALRGPRDRDDGRRPASTRTSSTPTRPRCCARRPG